MSKTDKVVRNAQDLEKKYNFAALLGLKKNVEITTQGIQKIENELNNMLNALIINLKDILEDQGEISLWFYSGIPTTKNQPYIQWENPTDHIGDIYYDQSSGIVYQWNNVWEVNPSPDLVEAMSITNSETDTSTDHERKVFFNVPVVPYSNGDWWIKNDGELYICQISKNTGIFEGNDFISSNKYTSSIAEKIEDTITVLKGTVTTLSESYAKFTDLATGGSTIISGDNVVTGKIKSKNYVKDESGTEIDLDNGTINSPNFKIDGIGDLYIGGYIQSARGLLTTKIIESAIISKQFMGSNAILPMGFSDTQTKDSLQFQFEIPNNFEVVEAYIILNHMPIKYTQENIMGYTRNLKLYKGSNVRTTKLEVDYVTYSAKYNGEFEEITSAFGNDGFTGSSEMSTSIKTEIELKDYIVKGTNILKIETSNSIPSNNIEILKQTGACKAALYINGYTKI